jgi:hypothetical protein
MRVKTAAAPETITELARFSPVYEMVSKALPVDLVVETHRGCR